MSFQPNGRIIEPGTGPYDGPAPTDEEIAQLIKSCYVKTLLHLSELSDKADRKSALAACTLILSRPEFEFGNPETALSNEDRNRHIKAALNNLMNGVHGVSHETGFEVAFEAAKVVFEIYDNNKAAIEALNVRDKAD
ncbi:MAG: hypothetical protein HLUCCA04_05355 [Oceanicaulis sp. HLUCCA04]|nr:MAG: hypothetical protein HLUCCA04_05355 [Oceanicaulis sp. HLUCCA04]